MKALSVLVRVHKHKIDQLIVVINNLKKQKKELGIALQALVAQGQYEIDEYSNTQYSMTLENFLKKNKKDQAKCSHEIFLMQYDIEKNQHELQTTFSELKKVDIVLQNKTNAINKSLARKETNVTDDIGTSIFNRKRALTSE